MTISAEDLSKDLNKHLNRVAKSQDIIDVETDGGNVVIISAAEFERVREELEVAQGIARGRADIAAGRYLTHEQMIAHMDAKIAKAQSGV